MLRTVFLLLAVASNSVVVIADEDPWEYSEPNWWNQMTEAKGTEIKRCQKREHAPVQGDVCSPGKVCYFGKQSCSSLEDAIDYPTLLCKCMYSGEGYTKYGWECVPQNCPKCPVKPPVEEGSICAAKGMKCEYGVEHCCGETTPTNSCSCTEDGTFDCFISDNCVLPKCIIQSWRHVISYTCDEAKEIIAESFPQLQVDCITGDVPEMADEDYNLNHMYVQLNEDGVVYVAPKVG